MIVHLKILSITVLLSFIHPIFSEETTPKDDLMESESKDPSKVEIIKQIKRVNDDGSYTFGYEAEDGTFKIESRDVLGNIKGTFGFVDSDGEIKRVSYTTTNSSESATVSTVEKGVIQQIPKNNRTISVSTTRRPNIIYPSSTSSVIQSIPRRRPGTISNSSSTERPNSTTSKSTEMPSAIRGGHYVRSTISPQTDSSRLEGQLARPNSDNATPTPTETSYPRRVLINRNPYLDEGSTIKPIVEESFDDNVRGNLLRRQLNQEKIPNFDARQHVLSLQQSSGDDSTDVYSASLTTGTPRPLFTTTDRSRIYATPTISTPKGITPIKYQPFYPSTPRPKPNQNYIQEATTDSTNTDTNYVSPTSVPEVPFIGRHPFHRGAILIPVNQLQNGRYVLQEPEDEPQYITQYAVPEQQYQIQPRRRPINDYYQPQPIITNDIQDDIDSIKPPVSTRDFQKLLNRLIFRQSQLQEISRLEHHMMNQRYQRVVQPTPVSVFVRTRPNPNGPVQFIAPPQTQRPRPFIAIPQNQNMQNLMESQQQYQTAEYTPTYHSGRRVARLLHPPKNEEDYLPADVREMLLLRMLQLAINPNLPLPSNEGENMVREIRHHKKGNVRNVEILGEERDEEKPVQRSKRYRESEEYEYY